MPLRGIPLLPLAAPIHGEMLAFGLPDESARLLAGALTSDFARRWFVVDDASFLQHVRDACLPFVEQVWRATTDPAAVLLGCACGLPKLLIPSSWPTTGRVPTRLLTRFQGADALGLDAELDPRQVRVVWARWAGTLISEVTRIFPNMWFDAAVAKKALADPLTPWLALTGSWDGAPDHVARVFSKLVVSGQIDLAAHIDAKLVASRRGLKSYSGAIFADVGSLERCLDLTYPIGDAAWESVRNIMRKLPDDELGAFALGAFDAFSRWLSVRFHCQALKPGAEWALAAETVGDVTHSWDRSLSTANALVPIARLLNERAEASSGKTEQASNEIRVASWIYTWRAFDGRAYRLPENVATRQATEASAYLGALRKIVRAADEQHAETDFAVATETGEHALRTLVTFGWLWDATKQLLLLLSYLRVPATSPDTRYWTEFEKPNPPTPWEWVPRMIAAVVHTFARRTEAKDPSLLAYREALADFCLQRLRTRDRKPSLPVSDEQMVEPRRCWRMAAIRALGELGVNPRGAGQRTVNWLAERDPDERVRELARSTAKRLGSITAPPVDSPTGQNMSPRRSIYTALWWFRRAALEGVGVEVDEAGAQSALARESRQDHEISPTQEDQFLSQ